MTSQNIDYKQIAFILTAGEPMAFKAYEDGSLVVIAHDGKKHRFTPEQVQAALPKPAPKPKRTTKTSVSRGRSSKTAPASKAVKD